MNLKSQPISPDSWSSIDLSLASDKLKRPWEIIPFRFLDLTYPKGKRTMKRYMIQAWDEINNSWFVPYCDLNRATAKAVVQRWLQDLVCRDQLPLWAIENYKEAADQEGETYLNRYRPLVILVRQYDYVHGDILPSQQEVLWQWAVIPKPVSWGVTWQAVRVVPNTPPKQCVDKMGQHVFWQKELLFTAKRLPWELKLPKEGSVGYKEYYSTR